jgi:hypothetical protein
MERVMTANAWFRKPIIVSDNECGETHCGQSLFFCLSVTNHLVAMPTRWQHKLYTQVEFYQKSQPASNLPIMKSKSVQENVDHLCTHI